MALSYYQTIHAYPSGGGSWIVARANLGIGPGLVAAAALLIDYVLVAAVSLTAGVEAIASAFPILWPYRVPVALVLLGLITLLNLRGLRETGTFLTIPVYAFLGAFFLMLAAGVWRAIQGGPQSARAGGTAGPGAADGRPGAACLCHRLHRPHRNRSHQQRRPGIQARLSRRTPGGRCW